MADMENTTELEEIINGFVKESKRIACENRKSGKDFNIFNELHIKTKETRHSLMIKSLITPDGRHGLGKVFYELFINKLELGDWLNDYDSIKVYDEYFIGNLDKNLNDEEKKHTYWGRIDLLIENESKKKAIIIENKIYANDQPDQLIRYNNFAKDKYDDYDLFYLTLDGKDPEFQSYLGNEKGEIDDQLEYQINLDKIHRISYTDHILNWLAECEKITNNNHPVKVIINQYISTIKELTNKMESLNKELLLGKYKSLLKTLYARDIVEVRDEIRKMFFRKLEESLQKKGFSTQFVCNIHQEVEIDNVLNSEGQAKNFGIRVTTTGNLTFNIEVQNYKHLIYGFFLAQDKSQNIDKDAYDGLEEKGLWLCKEYDINNYEFYDDRLNYHLLENMENEVNKLVDDIIKTIRKNNNQN